MSKKSVQIIKDSPLPYVAAAFTLLSAVIYAIIFRQMSSLSLNNRESLRKRSLGRRKRRYYREYRMLDARRLKNGYQIAN